PGPFASMFLSDLGADVIRIESPSRPDMVRLLPPSDGGVGACHAFLNRSKRSLSLDLKNPAGVEVIKSLVKEYDIVLEQFRPGVMDRLGVGYEALKAINPGVIYCSITGYGQTGPFKDRAGHDLNYLAIAGVLGYNGRKASGPAPINVQVADVAGGSFHAVMGILAAVIHRSKTGEGQFVDVSMTDAAFSLHALTAPPALVGGLEPGLENTQLNGGTFYDCYETQDGRYMSVGGLEPQFFLQFVSALGHPEWAPKGVMISPDVQKPLKEDIAAIMKTKTFAEWSEIFAKLDACVEPVLSFTEATVSPQAQARNFIVEVPKPDGTKQRQLAHPIKYSKTQPRYDYIGAALGEHTREILREAGLDDAAIDGLIKSGVVSTQ
ncbi:MAG TPA: CaiB/BaiF CoA-transferase family protein, partial [Pseudomonadales bacterium]|nr:CaiB/BaiF CoA-transferase family protein [Pseudomonadales bacterium]